MSVADDIKSRLDIVSYIQQTVPLKKAGRNYKACCPFHAEKTPSFVVNPETQTWRCFGACAEGGDVFSFAMKLHGWSFSEALRELGRQVGVEVRPRSPQQQTADAHLDALRGLLQTAAEFFHARLWDNPDPLDYARRKRGFTDATLAAYSIGYAPDAWTALHDHLVALGYDDDMLIEAGLARRSESGRVYDYFRNRLMIPIRDERGRVIGFGARALNPDDNPKYLNSPQTPLFDKSRTLFGLDAAKRAIRDSETAVIVEGYMDAIQAHQAGFLNVVAQMGTAMTEPQLRLLVPRWASRVILALDSDAAGQSATMRSLEVARAALRADYTGRLKVELRVLQTPDAKDPDDLIRETPERWQALVEAAVPVADYVIDTEIASLPPDAGAQQVESLARRLLPILLASDNSQYARENVQKLALRLVKLKHERRLTALAVNERDLLAWAAEQERVQRAQPPRRFDAPPPSEPPEWAGQPPLPTGSEPLRAQPTASARRRPPAETAYREAEVLRALLAEPDLVYAVNRKLRELAGSDPALQRGPLRPLEVDDFGHSDHRAIMAAFQAALRQDEREPFEQLQLTLDDELRAALDEIMTDALDTLRPRLRHGLQADLTVHLRRSKSTVDARSKLIENALYLRHQRLKRECEDLTVLMMDAPSAGDEQAFAAFSRLSVRAKGLIEAELKQQARVQY